MNDEQKAWLELMEAARRRREETVTTCGMEFAKHCAPILGEAGVRRLEIAYSGSGDSGGVDFVEAFGDDDVRLTTLCGQLGGIESLLEDKHKGAARILDNLIDMILPSGFEINDGGQGRITIDVVHGTWKLHHEENITSIEEHEVEGKF